MISNIEEKRIVIPEHIYADKTKNCFINRLYLTELGGYSNLAAPFSDSRIDLNSYTYIYCVAGTGVVKIDDKLYILTQNTAICIPKGQAYILSAVEDETWTVLWASFNGADICFFPLEKSDCGEFTPLRVSKRILSMFNQLFKVAEDYADQTVYTYISQTLQMILSETYYQPKTLQTQDVHNHTLNQITKFFHQNISRPVTLQEVCEKFKLSKSYLHLLFQKCLNTSPIDFFIDLKIKNACQMLRSTNLTVKIIAANLGYFDQYHFSALFKKYTGVSPSEYRKSNMQSI